MGKNLKGRELTREKRRERKREKTGSFFRPLMSSFQMPTSVPKTDIPINAHYHAGAL